MKLVLIATAIAFAAPALAQTQEQAPPSMPQADTATPFAVQKKSEGNAFLPANTEVLLEMNQEVTTKGKTWSEGDTFNLSVVHDVMLGDYVIIPEGSKAVGRIAWLTNKGMFGKSGKMDIELEYAEVRGRRIDLNGTYRQEGEGNTLATVGGVVAAGPFAAFITGRSGRIPQGRELMATTESDLELAIPASAITARPKKELPLANEAAMPLPVQPK